MQTAPPTPHGATGELEQRWFIKRWSTVVTPIPLRPSDPPLSDGHLQVLLVVRGVGGAEKVPAGLHPHLAS